MVALVADPGARPISGIRLTLSAPDGRAIGNAITGGDGTAAFEDLPAGRYTIRTHTAGGRRSRSTHVLVRAGLESTVILTLEADDADTVIVKPKR